MEPKDSKAVECIFCGWKGTLKDCKKEWVDSDGQSWRMLAGRRGWEWKCPECKFTVENYYYMVS